MGKNGEKDKKEVKENVPKVAVAKVGVPSMKFKLPETMLLSLPSPYIMTFHLLLSRMMFSKYFPAFTCITNRVLLFFGIFPTASSIVLQSPEPSFATVTFGVGFVSWRSLRSPAPTQSGY